MDTNVRLICAVAQEFPGDAAFELLKSDFIDGFSKYYKEIVKRIRENGNDSYPVVLKALVDYCIAELPLRIPQCDSIALIRSPEKQRAIVKNFLNNSLADLLTLLAMRDSIANTCKNFLHTKDTQGIHGAIEAKFSVVYTDFIEVFRKNSAAMYQFRGAFNTFVVYCFTNFYYSAYKRNIWTMLRASDIARQDFEMSKAVKSVTNQRTDDVYIHDMVLNINKSNDLLFSHAGLTSEARGVTYDIYYLILGYLCEKFAVKVNEALSQDGLPYKIKYVDELDRKSSSSIYMFNKGIGSKITNAKDLIPLIYEKVHTGDWSFDISDLRDLAFIHGKRDCDGKNSPWRNITERGETSRYLDDSTGAAIKNYKSFDCIFKGVLSVHALMSALAERGYDLVESYQEYSFIFSDKDVVRYIDYLSSLKYLPLMKELQKESGLQLDEHSASIAAEEATQHRNHGELLSFHDMVHEYAGSSQNQRTQIRENRYNAYTAGLLVAGRRKQKGRFQTDFEILHSLSAFFTAIPRCYEEYLLVEPPIGNTNIAPEIVVPEHHLVAEKYCSVYSNYFISVDKDVARYYLNNLALGTKDLADYEWNFSRARFPMLLFNYLTNPVTGSYTTSGCIYVPMADRFILCTPSNNGEMPICTYSELIKFCQQSVVDGTQRISITPGYAPIPSIAFARALENQSTDLDLALKNSISFQSLFGIDNLTYSDSLRNIPVYKKFTPYTIQYVEWLSELSSLQMEIVNLLYCMTTYSMFILTNNDNHGTADWDEAHDLINSLLISEFKESNLNWFFARLDESINQFGELKQVNQKWGKVFSYSSPYTSLNVDKVLTLIYHPENVDTHQTIMENIVSRLMRLSTVPQRFTVLFNIVNSTQIFLRGLRDAYELIFNIVIVKLSTLGCELNSRFHIEDFFHSDSLDGKYALIDSLGSDEISQVISETYQYCSLSYSPLVKSLCSYFNNCRESLSVFLNYNVFGSESANDKLKMYGSMLSEAGFYTHRFVKEAMTKLRATSKVDDAGFISNVYLRNTGVNSDVYYIHITGRILKVSNGVYTPLSFDFSKESDRQRYQEILMDGR